MIEQYLKGKVSRLAYKEQVSNTRWTTVAGSSFSKSLKPKNTPPKPKN
jgi:hypothetical protein